MRIRDPNKRDTRPDLQALLKAAIVDYQGKTFDDVRRDVPELADLTDGELHQLALDSGLEVLPEATRSA